MNLGLAVTGARILVADDEADVLALVGSTLLREGYDVLRAADGAEALSLARQKLPALAILDLSMPEMSGLEVCRVLKSDPLTSPISVVLLTARTGEVDRIVAFEFGADDYVKKPFSPRELTLRIRAILRRKHGLTSSSPFLQAGDIAVDVERHHVTISGKAVDLTAVEFKLLVTLMERKGRVQTREALINAIWGLDEEIGTRTIDTHLRRLRNKLGPAAEHVQTVRGFGYRIDDRR